MRLQRVELHNFRQFDQTLLIEHFDAQFNLICGDNEAGKSTLLLAIQAALFERYDRGAGERLRPYQASVSPEIKLDFSLADKTYQLHKVFSKRSDKLAQLNCSDGQRWEGPAAEDQLQQLLGFSRPTRGETKPELQGIPGLLWVTQTTAFQPIRQTNDTQSRLQTTLDQEIDELLGGESGQQLLDTIEQQLSEYLGRSGKPVGDYKKLLDNEAELAERRTSVEQQLSDYNNLIDRLQQLQERQNRHTQEQSLKHAKQQLIEAQQEAGNVERLRKQLD
ncbi:MAG: AAA family ATPase, partial [Chromatiales bacterium]|nr:AAA family ATPase [Chromatiales bacterium]